MFFCALANACSLISVPSYLCCSRHMCVCVLSYKCPVWFMCYHVCALIIFDTVLIVITFTLLFAGDSLAVFTQTMDHHQPPAAPAVRKPPGGYHDLGRECAGQPHQLDQCRALSHGRPDRREMPLQRDA